MQLQLHPSPWRAARQPHTWPPHLAAASHVWRTAAAERPATAQMARERMNGALMRALLGAAHRDGLIIPWGVDASEWRADDIDEASLTELYIYFCGAAHWQTRKQPLGMPLWRGRYCCLRRGSEPAADLRIARHILSNLNPKAGDGLERPSKCGRSWMRPL